MSIPLLQFLPDKLDKVVDLIIMGNTHRAVAMLVRESERLSRHLYEERKREQGS